MTTRAVRQSDTAYDTKPSAPALGTGHKILRAVALASAVPYLAMKAAWLGGSRIGIPDGSVLLEHGLFFAVANAVTLVMDATVILLVLVLTRPWGMRVPSWPLVVPAFVATGLLIPIFTGFPGQIAVKALGMGADEAAQAAQEPFLDPWVFNIVYIGFMLQGLALAGLFVPYARERWGTLWQGVLGKGLPSSTGVVAGASAVLGLAVAAVQLYWAFGGTAGLSANQIAVYSAETGVVNAVHAMCALVAVAGVLLLARGGQRAARWPLVLAWTGSAAALSWGAWLLIAVLGPDPDGEQPSAILHLAYAGQMITGILGAVVLTRFLASRRTV
ncbi:hypothetical protein [Streptomyces sp. TBY4]|uniref:hypothetical protein n=1 Tax=Streptomyces sp. TBY4 TaxID=2962030 RepID=UPI0020B80049|nr:hypothetical protein [Streptomyces sp. TBY4]MCP3756732.1 hypothetical protein [Streptomyces sp. TBY4]